MVEKDKFDIIYPSTEQDLVEAFDHSPDILNVHEDSDGLISMVQSKPGTVVQNYLVADLKWSRFRGDKPFYPTLRYSSPRNFIEISFMENGYTVNAYNQQGDPLKKFPNRQQRVEEIMDSIQRGISFIEIFRSIPIHLRADIRNKYMRKLDCKITGIQEPTLDCLSLTSRAINMVQKGKIREIITKKTK